MSMKRQKSVVNTLNIIALSTFLSGCALVPDLGESPRIKPVEVYEAKDTLAPSTNGSWPQSVWWHTYGDQQLSALIEEALAKNPTLVQADARVRMAAAVAEQTGANLYPNISANGSYSNLRQSYNIGVPVPEGQRDTAAATLDLRYQLDFWGKNRALLAAATSETEAARLEKEQASLLVSTSIAAAYANLAQLYANLDAANDALRVRQKSVELIRQRQQNGLENLGSYEQEIAAVASADAEIEAIKEHIALAKNALVALMGVGPDRAQSIERPDIQKLTPFGLPDNLPAELLGRRPDIVAAKLQAEAASNRTDAAKASFYPNVNLVGSVGQSVLGLGYFGAADSLVAAIGPTVSLPIFDGSRLRGAYRQARAGTDAAVATYDATLQNALHEVADVVTSEKMLAPRLEKTTAALKASEKAYTVINNRYVGGLAGYLEVLRSEDALIANQRALADLKTRSFTLDVALVRALGGGFAATEASAKQEK